MREDRQLPKGHGKRPENKNQPVQDNLEKNTTEKEDEPGTK